MIKITCSCGNEATRVKKENDNLNPKFNIDEIRQNNRTIGIGIECLKCGTKLDLTQ